MKIKTGDIIKSATGRELSPVPKLDYSTNRKCINSEKRLNAWLKEEAIKECQILGNELAELTVRNIDVRKEISQSDSGTLYMILFDEEFQKIPVPKPFLKPIQVKNSER